ncbi:Alternate 30S ribosomal protein S14 [Chlamydia trachomatis]|nr:Alternate 30S ribosomal protein S14 [Chlamydia trachomatis]
MAKKSKVIKAQKQLAMVEKYAELRKELKEKGDYAALAKLPRDS